MSELADIYQTRVAAGEIAEDPAQRTALQALEGLRAYLEAPKTGRLSGILKRKAMVRAASIFGAVSGAASQC